MRYSIFWNLFLNEILLLLGLDFHISDIESSHRSAQKFTNPAFLVEKLEFLAILMHRLRVLGQAWHEPA
ncbi:hypothetical protein [Sinorhizobium meliloti]|uniref:hypothetical protein n=1 Tax=Rhizobium meliloti TaxID=382 RepID=UPI003D654F49